MAAVSGETRGPRRERESESTRHRSSRDDGKRHDKMESRSRVEDEPPEKRQKKDEAAVMLNSKTGGAYIPPARLKMMQAQITDKSSEAYQRLAWEALKKTIHGLINKVNTSNISHVIQDLFKENIVRGRGLFARSCIDAQTQSPTFTPVYAALVAVINTKFPQIGELVLKRLIKNFRNAYRRNQKAACLASTRFIAHLVNQQVADEVIALEIVTLLLETPTDDSLEVAIGFLKECGLKLKEIAPRGLNAVFDQLNTLLLEGKIDTRVQYMVEVMMAVRKDGFKDFPSVPEALDLVEEEDQFTHPLTLEENYNPEDILNVFHFDPEFESNEEKYKTIRKEILGEADDGSGDEDASGSGSDEDEDAEPPAGTTVEATIVDNTETNLVALRRTIYLTIQSSLDYEECCHKLLKIDIKPGQEAELCHMILDCCSQQRTYEKFFGLLAQRFCQINQQYVEPYQKIFTDSYDTIHRLETNKLRNVGKFFGHLLFTDAISWLVLGHVKLNEDDTTSSSRIFIKILFQELAEYMGMSKLLERIRDPGLQEAFDGLFPRDQPKNTRFAINFFTSIGLGGLTDDLRAHLQAAPKPVETPAAVQEASSSSSGSESDSESSSDSSASPSPPREEERRKNYRSGKQDRSRNSDKRRSSSDRNNNRSREGDRRDDEHRSSRDRERRKDRRDDDDNSRSKDQNRSPEDRSRRRR